MFLTLLQGSKKQSDAALGVGVEPRDHGPPEHCKYPTRLWISAEGMTSASFTQSRSAQSWDMKGLKAAGAVTGDTGHGPGSKAEGLVLTGIK